MDGLSAARVGLGVGGGYAHLHAEDEGVAGDARVVDQHRNLPRMRAASIRDSHHTKPASIVEAIESSESFTGTLWPRPERAHVSLAFLLMLKNRA